MSLEDQESLPYRLYIEELERQKGVTLALQEQVSYNKYAFNFVVSSQQESTGIIIATFIKARPKKQVLSFSNLYPGSQRWPPA